MTSRCIGNPVRDFNTGLLFIVNLSSKIDTKLILRPSTKRFFLAVSPVRFLAEYAFLHSAFNPLDEYLRCLPRNGLLTTINNANVHLISVCVYFVFLPWPGHSQKGRVIAPKRKTSIGRLGRPFLSFSLFLSLLFSYSLPPATYLSSFSTPHPTPIHHPLLLQT